MRGKEVKKIQKEHTGHYPYEYEPPFAYSGRLCRRDYQAYGRGGKHNPGAVPKHCVVPFMWQCLYHKTQQGSYYRGKAQPSRTYPNLNHSFMFLGVKITKKSFDFSNNKANFANLKKTESQVMLSIARQPFKVSQAVLFSHCPIIEQLRNLCLYRYD